MATFQKKNIKNGFNNETIACPWRIITNKFEELNNHEELLTTLEPIEFANRSEKACNEFYPTVLFCIYGWVSPGSSDF